MRAFAHLSRFLTLGLINTVEDVSTWKDFMLAERAEGS